MKPAPTAAAVSVPNGWRHERKLLPSGMPLPAVLALVHRHPAGFREVYLPRPVNNIYLDTPTLRDYHDHVCGAPERGKTRIRWYGALGGPIPTPVLERKRKRGAVSSKESWPLPPISLNGGFHEGMLRDLAGRGGLPPALGFQLPSLRPTLINRYERRYFLSGDGLVRLTVDSDLRFLSPASTHRGVDADPHGHNPAIIELKYAPQHAARAAEITNRFPFRISRFSKYVEGIRRLHPA